jgi:amino acid transporter
LGAAMMAACAAWNIAGARQVGEASVALTLILLVPFAWITAIAFARPPQLPAAVPSGDTASPGILAGVFVALWNQMGWDNASTIAGEVQRPQRTYPLTMGIAVALVSVTYLVPVAAAAHSGVDPSFWQTGAWVELGRTLGGPWLGGAVVVGGMVCGVGMFDALLMSYSRLPVVLAQDGYLPRVLAKRHKRSGAPWVAVVVCCIVYTSCLGLGFQRLIVLDVVLYGLSLVLEFGALILLRIREPALPRPFRIPGGLAGAVATAVLPTALVAVALVKGTNARALVVGAVFVALGPVVYAWRKQRV